MYIQVFSTNSARLRRFYRLSCKMTGERRVLRGIDWKKPVPLQLLSNRPLQIYAAYFFALSDRAAQMKKTKLHANGTTKPSHT